MPPTYPTEVTMDVHLGPDELMAGMRHDALHGLGTRPRELPPTWFYDNVGCRLFDAITELEEYYPTRAERAILLAHGDEIAKASQADTFIELGSGTSDKTRHLLDAMLQLGQLERYVPFDVAEPTLRQAADQLVNEYPGLVVHGVVGDFRPPDLIRLGFAPLQLTLGDVDEAMDRLATILATGAWERWQHAPRPVVT